MDKMLSVCQKKANKQHKNKKNPVKVVYISNPMKVKTSASEFRALVQELTGQYAEMPDPTKFSGIESVGGGSQEEVFAQLKAMEENNDHVLKVPPVQPGGEMARDDHFACESYDDDIEFMPQMLESFPGLIPSNLWFESTHADELKSLDIM